MTMAQRTSSAAELTKRPPVTEGFGTPISKLEFSPVPVPETGLFYLKNDSKTVHGDWVVLDGFYLSSHGDRPAVAILVSKACIGGIFSEDKYIPSQITKAGAGVYFLSRDMAEHAIKKMLESNETIEHTMAVCHGKTYNNLVDQLEDRDQAGHFEDGQVLVVNVEQPDGAGVWPCMIGLTEMLVEKKLHLVHVVAQLEKTSGNLKHLKLHDRQSLIKPMYYSSEAVARMAYKDLKAAVQKPLVSLVGRSYEEMAQYLKQNSK